jgi:hypothetical protein
MDENSPKIEEPQKKDGRIASLVGFWLMITYIIFSIIRIFVIWRGLAGYSLFGLWPASIILGIIGWVRSKRAGKINPFAAATVIMAIIVVLFSCIFGTYLRMQNQY